MKHGRPLLGMLIALLATLGCGNSDQPARTAGPETAAVDEGATQWHDELLTYAVNNLNRLEEFDAGDMLPQIVRRIEALQRQDAASWDPKTDGLAASWPEPDMLRQVVNRLNQWVPTQPPPSAWRLDPMAAQLPASVKELPQVESLGKMEFSSYDGFALQEAVWLRDLSNWVRGDSVDDLARTRRMFDWVVRNIQLERDWRDRTPLLPWEMLMLGRGTASERAWLFIVMARQQGLDAAMLAIDASAAARPHCEGPRFAVQSAAVGGRRADRREIAPV